MDELLTDALKLPGYRNLSVACSHKAASAVNAAKQAGASSERYRHAHRKISTSALSGSWSLPVMSIIGCMPLRRTLRA
jgi:hypothetical protein